MPSWQPDLIKTVRDGVMIAFWFLARGGFRRGPSTAGYDIPVPEAPTGPDLLDGAQCAGRALNAMQERCFWPTDEQALFVRQTSGNGVYHVVLQDRLGRVTPLESFNARAGTRLQGHRMVTGPEGVGRQPARANPPEAALSPDGEWLLWEDQQSAARGAGTGPWVAARLYVTEEQSWTAGLFAGWHPDGIAWSHSGDRWFELLVSPRWRQYTITGARAHGLDGSTGEPVGVQPSIPGGLLCGTTARDELVLRSGAPFQSLKERPLWFLDPDAGRTEKASLPLPYRATLEEMQLSRLGERFALLLSTSIERSFFPRRYALWTCALDGSDWELIGVVDGRSVEDAGTLSGRYYAWPQELCWLPNGREVSFVFDGRLFLVPVTDRVKGKETTS